MKKEKFSRSVLLVNMAGLTVVVAIVYLAYLSHKNYEDTVVSQTQQQLLMSARSIAVGIEEFVAGHRDDLATISRNPTIQEKVYKGILVRKPSTHHCPCRDLYSDDYAGPRVQYCMGQRYSKRLVRTEPDWQQVL